MDFGDPTDDLAAEWRGLLEAAVARYLDLPLMLSGGLDSGTILAAMLHLGARPDCYSFCLGSQVSADLRVTAKMCEDHGLRLDVAEIARTEGTLIADVREAIALTGTSRKASVQCAQPVIYMARAMRRDGYSRAIIGTGCIALDDRRMAVLWREDQAEAEAYRQLKATDRYNPTGCGFMHYAAHQVGVDTEEPYTDEPLLSFALAVPWDEMNKPKQKGIALRAYPGFWRKGYYRRNDPLQIGTGIRRWHDTLLASSHNKRQSKAVVAIYNDIFAGLGDAGRDAAQAHRAFFEEQKRHAMEK